MPYQMVTVVLVGATWVTLIWNLGVVLAVEKRVPKPAESADIRRLSDHFSDVNDSLDPWRFVPPENIERATKAEHPGLLAIYERGLGKDVRGILKHPIRIEDYPLPWQFQCGWMQNFDAMTGRSPTQVNYAFGVNLVLAFSDPKSWPAERTQCPQNSHSLQLLVVHLGNYGEVGEGLPQLKTATHPSPETYLVWGRGDLAGPAAGDWQIPNIYIGDGARYGGPASNQVYFRVVIDSPTQISVGVKFDASHGWNMRSIDVSRFGQITGIWEIGPIISGDRWIPDELAPKLGLNTSARVLPPDPKFEYYLDYCVFFGASPMPLEHHSDEFNIPGYLGQWQIQEQGTIVESYSHPGYLAVHLLGPSMGTGIGNAGVSNLNLQRYRPPWEIEISLIPPDEKYPWNFFLNFGIYDGPFQDPHWVALQGGQISAPQGELIGYWHPGIENTTSGGLAPMKTRGKPAIDVEFDPPVPHEILSHDPVQMLIQVIDDSHVRLGFRARSEDPWYLSKIHDTRRSIGKPIGQLGPHHVWSILTGPKWGGEYGLPAHQKFLIDYVRYRYGLTAH